MCLQPDRRVCTRKLPTSPSLLLPLRIDLLRMFPVPLIFVFIMGLDDCWAKPRSRAQLQGGVAQRFLLALPLKGRLVHVAPSVLQFSERSLGGFGRENIEHCNSGGMEGRFVEAESGESTDDVEGERMVVEDFVLGMFSRVRFSRFLGLGVHAGFESCGRRSMAHRFRYPKRSAERA